ANSVCSLSHRERGGVRGYALSRDLTPPTPTLSPAGRGSPPRARRGYGLTHPRSKKEWINMKINANGISFNYQIDGRKGAPWLIFSNALMTSLAMWDDQVVALKDNYRILRYDQRGHGETEATDGTYTFDTLTADAIALMDAVSIKRAHFAGISM